MSNVLQRGASIAGLLILVASLHLAASLAGTLACLIAAAALGAVGVLLWLVNTYIPMDPKIKSILNAVVVIAVVIYLLQVFGLLGTLENIKVGHAT